jgi:hypothetical protein
LEFDPHALIEINLCRRNVIVERTGPYPVDTEILKRIRTESIIRPN